VGRCDPPLRAVPIHNEIIGLFSLGGYADDSKEISSKEGRRKGSAAEAAKPEK
jgi:hypothetical protein